MRLHLYFMDLIKGEIENDASFDPVNFKNQRKMVRQLPQTQKSKVNKTIDAARHALLPGKRISKTGKIYWESRRSRSDEKGKTV